MDLIGYLETVQSAKLAGLYDSPAVCSTVLRNLPFLAGQYIARLAFTDGSVPQAIVSSWASAEAAEEHELAVDKLTRLGLLHESTGKGGQAAYALNPTFAARVRDIVLSGYRGGYLHKQPGSAAPSRVVLGGYADHQWQDLLLYLIGSGAAPPRAPAGFGGFDLAVLLSEAGLVGSPGTSRITEEGFQFLLMDTYRQLWAIVRSYISRSDSGAELATVVQFLLNVGALGGRSVCLDELVEAERPVAEHMAQLGILMPWEAGGAQWLTPTPLAGVLAGGGAEGGSSSPGFIIVETNFRVYAYTSSVVQRDILRFFVRCDVLLPNLFVGTITRASVMSALESGITADQVVAYLRNHAHVRVASNQPVVPGVVSDQIGLWEWETQRLRQTRAVLYSNFETKGLFEAFLTYVQRRGIQLYSSSDKKQVVVATEAHDQCKAEIRRLKVQMGL